MKLQLDVHQKDGKPEYVEVEAGNGMVATIPDLQNVAKIIWPGVDLERVWLTPATFLKGVRLTNVDIKDAHDQAKAEKV